MTPYYVPCEGPSCSNWTMGEDVWCDTCQRSLCRTHYDSSQHKCRYTDMQTLTNDVGKALQDLDKVAIGKKAESLRPGHECEVHIPSAMDVLSLQGAGGCNLHVGLLYDDGVEWYLRTPIFCETPARAEVLQRVRQSEYLTYKALQQAGVAVPTVRDWGYGDLSKTKDPRSTYIIYDKLPGKTRWSLRDYDKHEISDLINLYVEQSIKLESAKFDKIGSLDIDDDTGTIIVGNNADLREMTSPEKPYFGGPFSTMREFYLYRIDQTLEAIRAGQTFRQGPVLGYLIHLELRRLVQETTVLDDEESEFFLQHPDSHLGNLLFTKHEISGLLDWEWAYTVCKTAAFGSPRWMWDTPYHLGTEDSLNDNEHLLCSAYERAGRDDLAACVRRARVHQRLGLTIGDTDFVTKSPEYMLACIRPLLEILDHGYRSDFPATMEAWRSRLMDVHQGDSGLRDVMALEKSLKKARRPSWIYRVVPRGLWGIVWSIRGRGE